ncbi:MAG TPA: GNVR domain-containing protein [Burkholderiales bacterium]
MNFAEFLIALRARRKAFAITLAAVILAAIAVALVVPKKYVSTSTLMLDARDEQSMSPTTRATLRDRNYMSTQVDLIKSGRVGVQVVKDLKLAQKPGMREAWEKATGGAVSIEDWIAGNLIEKVRVDIPGSNVITIQYSSSDPKQAAAVANAFAKAYQETVLALRTEPSREAAQWFEGQLRTMRTQLQQAQTKMASYQKAKGITSADERTDIETARLDALSSQYSAARNATYDAVSRYKQANELVSAAAGGSGIESMPEILANGHLNGLKVDLTRLEQRLEQESTVLGEKHPQFQRTKAEIQTLKDKIASEVKKVVASLGNAVETSKKREQELKEAVQQQNERVINMKDARIELASMSADVGNAQRNYDAVLARFMTNKIEASAKSTNVALLSPAIEPLEPAQPKVGLISGLAVLIGGMLAAAVVFVLESMDRRVRTRADLETRLAVPSLGRLSRWQPTGGRLLPAPATASPARALPQPW